MRIGIGIVAIGSLLLILNHLLFNSQLVIVAFGLDKGSSLLLSNGDRDEDDDDTVPLFLSLFDEVSA
jgi:hypothetical protein